MSTSGAQQPSEEAKRDFDSLVASTLGVIKSILLKINSGDAKKTEIITKMIPFEGTTVCIIAKTQKTPPLFCQLCIIDRKSYSLADERKVFSMFNPKQIAEIDHKLSLQLSATVWNYPNVLKNDPSLGPETLDLVDKTNMILEARGSGICIGVKISIVDVDTSQKK